MQYSLPSLKHLSGNSQYRLPNFFLTLFLHCATVWQNSLRYIELNKLNISSGRHIFSILEK